LLLTNPNAFRILEAAGPNINQLLGHTYLDGMGCSIMLRMRVDLRGEMIAFAEQEKRSLGNLAAIPTPSFWTPLDVKRGTL
jgi:hypothetical protein